MCRSLMEFIFVVSKPLDLFFPLHLRANVIKSNKNETIFTLWSGKKQTICWRRHSTVPANQRMSELEDDQFIITLNNVCQIHLNDV